MDNNSPFPESKSAFDNFELQFTQQAQGFLRETAKWAKFLSILGFIAVAFMIIGGLAMFAIGGALGSSGMGAGAGMFGAIGGATIGVIYLVLAALYFFPVLYLYRFSSSAKEALDSNNTERLTLAMENLKSHYKFVGILTIVIIAFYILAIIFAVIAGVGAASGM